MNRPLSPSSRIFWPGLIFWLWCVHALYWTAVSPLINATVGSYATVGPKVMQRYGADLIFLPLPALFTIALVIAALKLSDLTAEDIGWRRPTGNAPLKFGAGAAVAIIKFAAVAAYEGRLAQVFQCAATGPRAAAFTAVTFGYGTEELVNRGVLCALLRRKIGRWPAIVASSAVFAFGHYQFGDFFGGGAPYYAVNQWPLFFGAGVVYCLLLDWSGSIAVPIVAHGLYNVLLSLHSLM